MPVQLCYSSIVHFSAAFSASVCPSVRPFVCYTHGLKTDKCVVNDLQHLVTLNMRVVWKLSDFPKISGYIITEMIQDWDRVELPLNTNRK